MKNKLKKIPRIFFPRGDDKIKISDYGVIELYQDEQISFIKESGRRYDVVSKSWGYYATPSVNKSLKIQGFKTAMVRNLKGNIFIMIVEKDKLDLFKKYCKDENQEIMEWLDEK